MSTPDPEQHDSSQQNPKPTVEHQRPDFGDMLWQAISATFKALQKITEQAIALLRLMVTAAMFAVVAFIIYNAYTSRNTVAVKPFQVPVSVGKENHEHAGRIIANQLNRHLLDAQNNLRERLKINIDTPVPDEESVLIEGESIKLPETGITIDNVIEFISGVFGRKNLSGSVYFESDLNDPETPKLYLQLTLRGRIISYHEDDLGQKRRDTLPSTQKNGLNIQLISAMLQARSKDILSIASEEYNLYYYCTREVDSIEHRQGEQDRFFSYCEQLHDGLATPDTLESLKQSLTKENNGSYDKTLIGSVLDYLSNEARNRQATLCQSALNRDNPICQDTALAKVRTSPVQNIVVPARSPSYTNTSAASTTTTATVSTNSSSAAGSFTALSTAPSPSKLRPGSLEALVAQCTAAEPIATTQAINIKALEEQCFTPQKQRLQTVADHEAILQSNQRQENGRQLFHNGLLGEALVNYEQAILLNCNNDVAWGNTGILLSTASKASGLRDLSQAQCALFRATGLNEGKPWQWHSLCVAQAYQATKDLEQFLTYDSCLKARELDPLNRALYDRLFYIDIAEKYNELEKYPQATEAYLQAMIQEKNRSCSMKKVFKALTELAQKGVTEAEGQACTIYNASEAPQDIENPGDCAVELEKMAEASGCV